MKPIPIHTAYLQPEEVPAIHEALLAAGHEELAGLLACKATRTEWEQQYAAAIQLGDENVFSMDDAPIVSASEGRGVCDGLAMGGSKRGFARNVRNRLTVFAPAMIIRSKSAKM